MLYARIFKNRISLRNVRTGQEIEEIPAEPFSTRRLLVGEFQPFSQCLRTAMAAVWSRSLLHRRPDILMQPMEMHEDGFCEIERRILQEGALCAGAGKALVHEGAEMNNDAVIARLRG